jgi:branched-chain amino acid transport system permease protein
MDYFAQQLINGLVLGSIYGLIAIGYTISPMAIFS